MYVYSGTKEVDKVAARSSGPKEKEKSYKNKDEKGYDGFIVGSYR